MTKVDTLFESYISLWDTVASKSIEVMEELAKSNDLIQQVRELHKTYWNEIVFCQTCDVPYPCPTIKTLDGEK